MAIVKYKGITANIGGEEYVIPPISLGALEQLQDKISAFTGDLTSSAQVASAIDVIHAALTRNYPGVTREAVAEMIDVGNMAEIFEAVMDVSGLKRKEAESGEVLPGKT